MKIEARDQGVPLLASALEYHESMRAPRAAAHSQTQAGMPHPHINTAYQPPAPLSAAQMMRPRTEPEQSTQIHHQLPVLTAAQTSVPSSVSSTPTPTARPSGLPMFSPDVQNVLAVRRSSNGEAQDSRSIRHTASPIDRHEERPVASGSNTGAAFERSRFKGASQRPGVLHAPALEKLQPNSAPQHTRQPVAGTNLGYPQQVANSLKAQSQLQQQPFIRRQQVPPPPPPPPPEQTDTSHPPTVPSQHSDDVPRRTYAASPPQGYVDAPPPTSSHPLQARPPPLQPSMHPPPSRPPAPTQSMYSIQAPNGATFHVTAEEFTRYGFTPGPAQPSRPVPEPPRRSSLESSIASARPTQGPPTRPSSAGAMQTLYPRPPDPKSRGDFATTLGFNFQNATQINAMAPLERARYLVSETAFWQQWRNEGPPKDVKARYRDAEARIGPLRQWLDQLGPELERDAHQLQLLSGPPKVFPPSSNGWQSSSSLIAAGGQPYRHALPPVQQDRPQLGFNVRRISSPASAQVPGAVRSIPLSAASDDVKMRLQTRPDADGAGIPKRSHTTTLALPRAPGPDDAWRPSSVRPPRSTPVEMSLELSSAPALTMPKAPRTSAVNLNDFATALGMACRQDLAVLGVSLAEPSSSSRASSASTPPNGRKRKHSEADAAPAPAPAPPKPRGRPRKAVASNASAAATATATTVEQDVALLLSALSSANVAELLERSVAGGNVGEVDGGALPELTEGEMAGLHAFLDACLRVPPGGDRDGMNMDGSVPVLAVPQCLVGLLDETSMGFDEDFAAAVLRHRQRARLRVAVDTWKELNGELITETALGRVRTHLRIILNHAGPLSSDAPFGSVLDNADGRLPDPPLAKKHTSTVTTPSVILTVPPDAKGHSTSSSNGSPHSNGTDADEMLVEIQSTRSISTGTAVGTPEPTDPDHGAAQFDALAKTLNLELPDLDSMPRTFGELGSMLDGMILQFKGLVDRMDIDMMPCLGPSS